MLYIVDVTGLADFPFRKQPLQQFATSPMRHITEVSTSPTKCSMTYTSAMWRVVKNDVFVEIQSKERVLFLSPIIFQNLNKNFISTLKSKEDAIRNHKHLLPPGRSDTMAKLRVSEVANGHSGLGEEKKGGF